jgi:hypothetical protein
MAVDLEAKPVPSDDGHAERWRRAKPLLTVGYAGGVPGLGVVGYAAWWRKSGA